MRILVCGGRNFGHVVRTAFDPKDEPPETLERIKEYNFVHDTLNDIVMRTSSLYDPRNNWLPTDIVIIHGGAKGADSAAGDFANINFCQEEAFSANWKRYGQRAGYVRNKKMLDQGRPDLVVAFPGGKGTANMVKLAKAAGVKVIEIEMGAKGSQTMADKSRAFKTERFEKIYCDRIQELAGFSSPYTRERILKELLDAEQDWLKNMGTEYEDIMQAQDLVDKANGTNTD